MKKSLLFFSALVLSLAIALPVYAKCSGGQCPIKKGGSHCSEGKSGCPIVGKFMKKAHFFLEHEQELGLKEDQVKAIKALKVEAKKAAIRQGAEMKIFHLDIESKLSEPKVDVEGINKMIDTGTASMAAGAKASLDAYVKLKAVLSDEQMAKAKEIWKKK